MHDGMIEISYVCKYYNQIDCIAIGWKHGLRVSVVRGWKDSRRTKFPSHRSTKVQRKAWKNQMFSKSQNIQ